MSRLLIGLALAAVAVLLLLPAPTAQALPGDCDQVCSCNSLCSQKCTVGGAYPPTTCGVGGVCRGLCRAPLGADVFAALARGEQIAAETAAAGEEAAMDSTGNGAACSTAVTH
jgi:hypothetical protein